MEEQSIIKLLLEQSKNNSTDPIRYANIVKASRSKAFDSLKKSGAEIRERLEALDATEKLSSDFKKYTSGDGYARKRKRTKDIFSSAEQQKKEMDVPEVDVAIMVYEIYRTVNNFYKTIYSGLESISNVNMITLESGLGKVNQELSSAEDVLGKSRVDSLSKKLQEMTEDAIRSLAVEQQMNVSSISSFNNGIAILSEIPTMFIQMTTSWARMYEAYFEKIRYRHQVEGYRIFGNNASLTDAAIMVWENLDKAGEIESGSSGDELSVYTTARAESMISALKDDEIWRWVVSPESRISMWVETSFAVAQAILTGVIDIKTSVGDSTWKLSAVNLSQVKSDVLDTISSLELSQIKERAAEKSLSKTERFMMEHRNKSIETVVNLLSENAEFEEITEKILDLKIVENRFFTLENSFYVCKIGNGNVFTGEAPGQLEVIPGEKPVANLKYIWGAGFDEARDFIDGFEEARKWQPLFLGTSPSGSTDKNNSLLVGPQGCGKSELMRAVAAHEDSISIFAVGSDFMTCWMGEAQKNPKRLFDQALKLHKSTGRPVHILIDEIDMVLNEDRSQSRINLSLEFQNLMDGIVAYPGITIWGATNHPERIPTPMLRRFAKVMVVGELSDSDRQSILKHYLERFLPCEDFSSHYSSWSKQLDGATGDVIRKVIDSIWLEFMRNFIKTDKKQAEKVLKFITKKYGEKMELASFEDSDREKIKELIGKVQKVKPEMVVQHITKSLDNFAVQQQVQVAKETYKNAKKLLADQKKASTGGLGF